MELSVARLILIPTVVDQAPQPPVEVFIDLSTGDGKDGSGIISKSHLQVRGFEDLGFRAKQKGIQQKLGMVVFFPSQKRFFVFCFVFSPFFQRDSTPKNWLANFQDQRHLKLGCQRRGSMNSQF